MIEKKQNRWRRLLRKAANILKNSGWCSGTRAKTSIGEPTHPLSKHAEQFCLVGALIRANGKNPTNAYGSNLNEVQKTDKENKVYYEAVAHLKSHPRIRTSRIGDSTAGMWEFNDKVAGSKKEVIKVLLETANA
jgi:hypothetical protein